MNRVLFRRTIRAQRTKLLAVSLGLAGWGFVLPIVYATYGSQFRGLLDSGVIPRELTQFGGGDIFSLKGSIALGFIHPIAVALDSVFAIGFAASAVAGERQRGTLEVLLTRPISRRSVVVTLFLALLTFVGIALAAFLVGSYVASVLGGVAGELDASRLPILWLNGVLLYGAFGALGLAASVSSDRLTPALGIALAVLLVSYFVDILGSLWPDARGLQPFSVFHYMRPADVLAGDLRGGDLAILATVMVIGLAVALWRFPRRDIAAPS
jgi:ABC-2 type transport system permease protein